MLFSRLPGLEPARLLNPNTWTPKAWSSGSTAMFRRQEVGLRITGVPMHKRRKDSASIIQPQLGGEPRPRTQLITHISSRSCATSSAPPSLHILDHHFLGLRCPPLCTRGTSHYRASPPARHHLLLASMYSSTRDLSARLGTKKGAMGQSRSRGWWWNESVVRHGL